MRKRLSIRTLILLMGLVPITLLCLIFGGFIVNNQIGNINKLMSDRAEGTVREFSALISPILEDTSSQASTKAGLSRMANSLLESPGTRSVAIYDAEAKLLLQSGPVLPAPEFTESAELPTNEQGRYFQLTRPVYGPALTQADFHAPLGWVQIGFHNHDYQLSKYQTLLVSSLGITAALCIAAILALYINLRLNQDTKSIRRALERLIKGEHNFYLQIAGDDSLSDIAELVNNLRQAHLQALSELENSIQQGHTDLHNTLETLEVQNIELDLARREAIEASRIKSEFLANTSHEIRTPLNAIIGFSNVLLKTELDKRQHQSTESIRIAAGNLLTIINDILDFSKLEAGKLVLDKGPVSIRDVLEETLQMQAPAALDKQLDLILDIDLDVPETVESDALRLKQVFTNLVSNAIKFTQHGHVIISVSASHFEQGMVTLNFNVTDTGIGLSGEQQKKLFRDFSQADASITRQYGGTGLGLVIVKRIIEQMHGEIGVESETGKGALFWVSLNLPISNTTLELRPFNRLQNKSVSLYATQPLQQNALQKLLQSWGIKVVAADSLDAMDSHTDYRLLALGCNDTESILPQVDRDNTVVISPCPKTELPQKAALLPAPVNHCQLFDALYRGRKAQTNEPQFSGNHVLLVDDNPANLLFLSDALSQFGIATVTAKNGPEAIQRCLSERFDLILMDIQMPQLDGIDTSTAIRHQGANTNTPIVLVSAHLAPDDPLQLRKAGINDFISKPVTDTQLRVIFERYLLVKEVNPSAFNGDTTERPVDIELCLQLAKQRPAMAKEMLGIMLNDLPSQLEQLRHAQNTNDWTSISQINHHLKGACCYTGVPKLKAAVETLEELLGPSLGNSVFTESTPELQRALKLVIDEAELLCQWREEFDLDVLFE
ncbi:response regulator [Spongiibacter sp. KMU-158]|uniref:histidine kinase n=1 Tax=Spongiibacter pelagi TaxID=2760804 RepID=A0A927BZR0_9GAMM|nr:ATP-binding protein [Spongiibacter pelagi]MBD2858584.1 response regulator [Spongiibacter pelagi]